MKKRSDRNDIEPCPAPFCHVLSLSHNQWETSKSERCPSEEGCWPVVTTTNKTSLDKTCGPSMLYRWEANVAWFRDNIEVTGRSDASQLWVITRPRDHESEWGLRSGEKNKHVHWKSEEIRHRMMANWLQVLSEEEETENQGSLRNSGPQMLRGAIQMSEREKVACKWNSRQRTFPPKK